MYSRVIISGPEEHGVRVGVATHAIIHSDALGRVCAFRAATLNSTGLEVLSFCQRTQT